MPPVIKHLSEVSFFSPDLKKRDDLVELSTFLSGTRVTVHRTVFDLVNVGIVAVLMEPNLRVPGIWYWDRLPVLAVINGGADGLLPDGTSIELSACKKHMLPEDKFVENMADVYHDDKRRDNQVLAAYLAALGAANPLVLLETPMRRTMKALSKWWSGTAIVPNPSESVHVGGAVNYGDTIESWYVHASAAFMSYDDGCSHIRAWLTRVYLAFATGYLVDFYGVTVCLRKVPKEFRDQHTALVVSIVEMVAERFGYTVSVLHQKGPTRNMVTVFFKVVAPPRYVQVGSAVMVDAWDQWGRVESIDGAMATVVDDAGEESCVSLSKLRVCGDRVAVLEAVAEREAVEVKVKKRKVEAGEETVKHTKYSCGHPGCSYESAYSSNICRHRKRHGLSRQSMAKALFDIVFASVRATIKRLDRKRRERKRLNGAPRSTDA
jgi:hypothetical protein